MPDIVRDVELRAGKRDAADQDRRPVPSARFGPAITTMRYAGMMTEIMAQIRPVIALRGIDGMPVTSRAW